MPTIRISRVALLGLACTALAGTAAEAASATHIRGIVTAVDGPAVTIQTREGNDFHLTLGDNWKLAGVVKASLADIKPGTFIGTANVPGASGAKALEVVVFPEALRGTGEGDYAWDLQPQSAMTNATVSSQVEGVDGRTLTLALKGGTTKAVTIPPDTPVVTLGPATAADIKPGVAVFISPAAGADPAKPDKGFVAVGRDGVVPPM